MGMHAGMVLIAAGALLACFGALKQTAPMATAVSGDQKLFQLPHRTGIYLGKPFTCRFLVLISDGLGCLPS